MITNFKNYISGKSISTKKVTAVNPLISLHELELKSRFLKRNVKVDLYLPTVGPEACIGGHPALFINDGQDMKQLRLVDTLTRLFSKGFIPPLSVVAICANENRKQEYGIARFPDFKKRGRKSGQHSGFITRELLPFLKEEYGLQTAPQNIAYAGFSLGGLSAFDIAWRNPDLFSKVGVFSGSFWWRSKNLGDARDDGHRITHRIVRATKIKPELKFWFQAGTRDEKRDRNKNGVIDAIEDTVDLIKELRDVGYEESAIVYREVDGGEHNFQTWAKVFPEFLVWAFGAP